MWETWDLKEKVESRWCCSSSSSSFSWSRFRLFSAPNIILLNFLGDSPPPFPCEDRHKFHNKNHAPALSLSLGKSRKRGNTEIESNSCGVMYKNWSLSGSVNLTIQNNRNKKREEEKRAKFEVKVKCYNNKNY